ASNQDEEYKSLFDDYKYDVQFMFRRAEVGLPPEVKASLDEKYKPYVFSEDNAEVVKSAVLPKQQRKVKEKAVKQKEKEIIAKEKPRAPTNVQKRSDSSEVEPTRERKKYVVKPVIDVKKWERKMGRSRTTEWLVGNAVL
uniref:Smg4_UPF3 domain-containing protein n=3 Tax=Bursaphelenchus xylophilus TaxID=6326 RepID=A0A1I7SK36_BURXY